MTNHQIATDAVRRQLKKVLDRGGRREKAEQVRKTLKEIRERVAPPIDGAKNMRPIDYKKVEELRRLANIPSNDGEQFINVDLNLVWGSAGTICFGFQHKLEMGEKDFGSLDEAIEIVKELRKRANL